METETSPTSNFSSIFLKTEPKQWVSFLRDDSSNDFITGLQLALRGYEIVIYSSDETSGKDLCKVMIRCSFGICQFMAYFNYNINITERILSLEDDVHLRDECFRQVSLTSEEIDSLIDEEYGNLQPDVLEVYRKRLSGHLLSFVPDVVMSENVKKMWMKDSQEKNEIIISTYKNHLVRIHQLDDPEFYDLVLPLELSPSIKSTFDSLAQFEGNSYKYMDRHCHVWSALLDEIEEDDM